MGRKKNKLSDVFKFNWGVENEIFNLNKTSHTIIGIDTGGTKTLVAHIDRDIIDAAKKKNIRIDSLSALEYYPNLDHGSLEEIIKDYLEKYEIEASHAFLSIAAAGPVKNGVISMSNHYWVIDKKSIQNHFHFLNVYLLNDLESLVYAIEKIDPSHLDIIHRARVEEFSPVALIAPGTGLGESIGIYIPEKGGRYAMATEGGNSDFAPGSEIEVELYTWLYKKNGYVSWEDVISGKGLLNIFQFLKEKGLKVSEQTLSEMKEKDPAEVISIHGLEKKDEACRKTLEIFISVLGSEAGNLALKSLPYGGLYIGGGICPKIRNIFKEPYFLNRFLNKGRLKEVLEEIPVYLIENSGYNVIGAINYALLT